jgi:tetratricopeptide (TPR) repeat protein
LAVIIAIAWSYGWNGRLDFQNSSASGKARIQSAELLLKSGQYLAATQQLKPILGNPQDPVYRQAQRTQWKIDWTNTMAQPPHSLAREKAQAALVLRLDQLLKEGHWSAEDYQLFAIDAQRIGAYDQSAEAWLAAAREDPEAARQAMDSAAAAWTANGKSVKAGQLLIQIALHTDQTLMQKDYFIRGLALIQGGGGARLALSQGEKALSQLPRIAWEHDIVLMMARLALSTGQPKLAAQWLKAELERPAQNHRS